MQVAGAVRSADLRLPADLFAGSTVQVNQPPVQRTPRNRARVRSRVRLRSLPAVAWNRRKLGRKAASRVNRAPPMPAGAIGTRGAEL